MRVDGEGPTPCDWMIVGEGPGWQEDRTGHPFVGKTGEELTRQCEGNHLPIPRKQIFLTNLYRIYGGKDYDFTAADLARDEPALRAELARVQPAVIIPLGRHAARYFLGDVDLDAVQGIPWYWPEDGTTVILPIVHPAAGFHNPEMSAYVTAGFSALSSFVAGILTPRSLFDDPIPEALADAVRRLNNNYDSYNPNTIKAQAALFSSDKFRKLITEIIA